MKVTHTHTHTVRNVVRDVNGNSTTAMGFRPVKTEETIVGERYRGIRDILWEEMIIRADNGRFSRSSLD